MDHPFRSAAFGGFNRQDVLAYLETTAKQSAQQLEELQQQLAQAQETVERQNASLTDLQGQVNRLNQDNSALRAQLEQTNVALSASRTEASQTAVQLDQVRRALTEEKAAAAALEPDAKAYRQIKERTAGVELEAHRRAQAVQEQAEQQAKQLRRQMEQWMQRLEREYDTLRTEVETTVSYAADQLDKAGKNLEKASALLGDQRMELESLAQAYVDTDPARVAAPMPIPEN